ncbi:MAG: hypothetical protein AAGE52_20555 [Myxococcota bacterium]
MRETLVCWLAQLASEVGSGWVTLALFIFGVASSIGVALARFVTKRFEPNTAAPGPPWVAGCLVAIVFYGIARLLDPLLASRLTRPADFPPELWERVGWFEWKILGDRWAWPLLPLDDQPALGLVLHAVLWGILIVAITWILKRLPGRAGVLRGVEVKYNSPEAFLPWYHRWVGATTAHGADARFRPWVRFLLIFLVPLHMAAGGLVSVGAIDSAGPSHAVECGTRQVERLIDLPEVLPGVDRAGMRRAAPSAGSWILGYYLLLFASLHLLLAGRPPKEAEAKASDEEDLDEEAAPPDPLARLGEALRAKRPEVRLETLTRQAGDEGETAPLPERTGPVVRELCRGLTGGDTLWSHQREILDHLMAGWSLDADEDRGPTPSLDEEVQRSPVRRQGDTPHALVLAAEGSGRTTLALLATLHVHFDRGATTLVVLRDRTQAREWAEHLRGALLRSAARWNVHVCVAGDDLSAALVAGKTPSVVVADVETFEHEVLSDPRSDSFIERLGLVVVDDLDELVGVAEMHMHVAMRRLWALVDTRRHAQETSYPLVLLAIGGPTTPMAGIESWARHVLAAPLRVFERNGAPRAEQVLLRRRDLVDSQGRDLPLHVIAEACDAAEIPWHMRLAGDTERRVHRAEIDLGRLRRHHQEDPRKAEVVLLEGRHPEVHREALRLAHAGVLAGSAVLVLAPPADDEMVLHEEADDAPLKALVTSLPRSVTLAEPDIVRQRHFDRTLGREHDVEALRARFGQRFVDEALERLRASDRVQTRPVWYFDRRRDDAAARTLVRATGLSALGEPMHRDCVSDSEERLRVLDQGTSEELMVVDRAIAKVRFPPGRVFLHPRGRYQVVGYGEGTILTDHVTERCRTTTEIELQVVLPSRLELTERQLGGEPIAVGCVRAQVDERAVGVRRYGPGPTLTEHRRYRKGEDGPLARYATDLCLLSTGERTLSRGAQIPLCAALRMMIPCALRGADELVDVGVVTHDERLHFAIYDRTPGASGYAKHLVRDGLKDLLSLARMVLERLVGAELVRLRRIHDTSPDGDHVRWNFSEALAFLDAVLDAPRTDAQHEPQVEYTPGEGEGDRGRLWMSQTGRTDDLVWTRHRWRAGGEAAHFDVAVERRAILNAIAHAVRAGASHEASAPRNADEWRDAHEILLRTGTWELDALRRQLDGIAGSRIVETVVSLVSAMPTRAHPLSPAERAPLTVLARRRADVDAKALAALVLLPERVDAAVMVGEAGCFLRAEGKTWDLNGPTPGIVEVEGLEKALGT